MKTVLVVEDNEINWKVFERILTKRGGLAAKHTEDVETVMQLAQSKQADLILMDIALANSYYEGKAVDGIKITQMLKANPETADLPIILVTAHGSDNDREYFLQKSGADGYISKPVIDYKAFVAEIQSKLSVRREAIAS
ncbi:MAG: response regulator [Limnoraphis robusta]|jgi:two-component system cell cycle response regulator DivK|uniref:Response regulator n=1 Tax=Limnoraphis robusta CCNP1315 TaxID=3110306 RepID=A0ABU5U432_9CYAN|nr:response regulator [Limnoraphis robusta]MCG5058890.1 response regulator [Limnoraphis sp. WC205]MEA5499566.1 response regulator [Limnoraphis robusta BA-68 BA1]MEA5521652.1 response regulator [Limnoraphis robusta CCNP1315]MEA5542481.1 response regulator [Limnoraphis robusta Tam1]MEA5548183.1 response regulator [Limnoraphis robusta CCNP1324]